MNYDQVRQDRFFRDSFFRLKAIARTMLRRLPEVAVTEEDLAQDGALAGLHHLDSAWKCAGYPEAAAQLDSLEKQAFAVSVTALKRDYIDLARGIIRRAKLDPQYDVLTRMQPPAPEDATAARQDLAMVRKWSMPNADYRALFESSLKLGDATPAEISSDAGVARVKFYRWRDVLNARTGRR